jgi:hypothetical protein
MFELLFVLCTTIHSCNSPIIIGRYSTMEACIRSLYHVAFAQTEWNLQNQAKGIRLFGFVNCGEVR